MFRKQQNLTHEDTTHQIKYRYTFKSYDELNAFYQSAKDYHSSREAFLGR